MKANSTSSKIPVARPIKSWLLLIQGLYFALLGLWPIIDIHSFPAVTGPKTNHLPTGNEDDHWLVVTVGALIASIGISLLTAYWTRSSPLQTGVLGILSALTLATVDVVYVWRKVIAPIYLADAAVELLFVVAWMAVVYCHSRELASAT